MRRARFASVMMMALCLGLPATAGAQMFQAGVKGGLSVSGAPLSGEVIDQVVGHMSIESSSRLGLAGGAYVRFPLSKLFSFQPEVLYVMKGVELTEANQGGKVGVRLHYIDAPLLVHIRVRPEQKMPGYLFGGVNFGMKTGSSATLNAPSGDQGVDIDPALKNLDLGISFGGGVERNRNFVEARITLGLTDIGQPSYPHPDAMHNRVFLVLFGKKLK